jgi:NADH-quinone oxidoreductase subunit L
VQEHGDHREDDDNFDPQDMRTMGGLRHRMKTTYVVFTIGALALAGIFPFAGFWSKDEILAHGWNNFEDSANFPIVWTLLTLAAFGTAFYVGRQLWLVFFGKPRHEAADHAVESPPLMTRPLIVLATLSILAGLLNFPFFSSAAAHTAEETHDLGVYLLVEQWLESSLGSLELEKVQQLVDVPETPINLLYSVAGISLVLAVGGLLLAWLVYRRRPEKATDPDPMEKIKPIWWFGVLPLNTLYYKTLVPGYSWLARFLAEKVDWQFWHDWFHDSVVRDGFIALSKWLSEKFDMRFIDDFLVNGAGRATGWFANVLRVTQTGYVRNYALAVFLGVITLLLWFLFIAI